MLLVMHFPSSGHSVLVLQLQDCEVDGGGVLLFFSRLTLCFVIIDLMFSMQE